MAKRLIDANSVLNQAWQNFYKQEDNHEKNIEDYDITRDQFYEQAGFECCQQTIVNAPTVLTIPENPTNGSLVKSMFPDVVIRVVTESQIGISFFDNQNEITWIPIEWWNAPYKGYNENE